MDIKEREPFQVGERVRDSRGIEGTVVWMNRVYASRRVEWDDGRTTTKHVAELFEDV